MTRSTDERRSTERHSTHFNGRIVVEGPDSPIDCIVWDLSETGARVSSPVPAEIPLTFSLEIPEEGASAEVRLIWSNGREHGVRFTDCPGDDGGDP